MKLSKREKEEIEKEWKSGFSRTQTIEILTLKISKATKPLEKTKIRRALSAGMNMGEAESPEQFFKALKKITL